MIYSEPITIQQTLAHATIRRHLIMAIVNRGNEEILCYGDPDYVSILHSLAKPFQVIPLFVTSARERFGFSNRDITIMMSSHNGEPEHRNVVKCLLERVRLTPEALHCGIHQPYFKWQLNDWNQLSWQEKLLANNCSGKHTAMLYLCEVMGIPIQGYTELDHPVQRLIWNTIMELLGVSHLSFLRDGCGVPTVKLDLLSLSILYLRLCGDMIPFEMIRNAIIDQPFYIAGTQRLETEIISRYGIIVKTGAEGVVAAVIPNRQMSIVLKAQSNSERSSEYAMLVVLMEQEHISEEEFRYLVSALKYDDFEWKRGKSI